MAEWDDDFTRQLIDQLGVGVYFVDRQRRIELWSGGAERITGWSQGEVLGRSCADGVLEHVDEQGELLCRSGCPLAETLRDGERREHVVYMRHRGGHRMPVRVSTAAIRGDDGTIVGGVEVFHDHSPWHRLADRVEQLERQALLDELTGLPNRRFLEQEIQLRFEEQRRYDWPFGVLFVDVDHFKRVNDTWGHDVGDRVLTVVARSLRAAIRAPDVVGRWGGEEFLVLVANVDEEGLRRVAERARSMVASSDAGGVRVTVSVGAAACRSGDEAESLLKRADDHLYRAKHQGRDRVVGP